jgi:hypothetical protein
MEVGLQDRSMDREHTYTQMDLSIRGNGRMTYRMERESLSQLIGIDTKESSSMEIVMEVGSTHTLQVIPTKENIRLIRDLVREHSISRMEINTMEVLNVL